MEMSEDYSGGHVLLHKVTLNIDMRIQKKAG